MARRRLPVFDADGHVWENDDELEPYFEGRDGKLERFRTFSFFPSLDGWARGFLGIEGMDPSTDAAVWGDMLDELGADGSVLYPTAGLAHGLIQDPAWAAALATAYNNWLEDRYTKPDGRLYGAGLMAVQDPAAAVAEMERCAARTGIVTMMLPSVNSTGRSYGDEFFWPILEAAERLDMPLAVHGGPSKGMGFDHLRPFIKVHTLEHPVPLFIQLTDLVLSGVFEEFPGLRIAFLEAGCTWVPWMMDRLDYEYGFLRHQAPRLGRKPSEYLRGDNFWVSAELEEEGLKYCLDAMGSDRILYPSDYPHEKARGEFCKDLDEFIDDAPYPDDVKVKILHDNAYEFYRLKR